MSDNRNISSCFGQENRGNMVIDTKRVLDACRDRDCFEDVRVYLSSEGESILNGATNIRAKCANTMWAYVGVDNVPFNDGFYRVTVRYYVIIEFEACLGIGRSQTINGLSVLEKEVILYGADGAVKTFSSDPENDYCSFGNFDNLGTTAPVATVETVEPIILGTKVVECGCPCATNEYIDIPNPLMGCLGTDIKVSTDGPRLYASLGLFSVIRLVRPAQIIVQATDYSVPDKECVEAECNENPCALFRTMAFPENRFRTSTSNYENNSKGRNGGCGCSNKR